MARDGMAGASASESQVDAGTGDVAGPLLAAAGAGPGPLTLRYAPGGELAAAHLAGTLCRRAAPPRVSWSLGGRTGALSAMSFVGLWNARARAVGGRVLALEVEDGPGLDLPFVAWHAAGTFQAVRLDRATGTFVRRLLYPMAPSGCLVALSARRSGPGGG